MLFSALLILAFLIAVPIAAVGLAYRSRRRINECRASCDAATPPAVALRGFLIECASLFTILLAWPFRPTLPAARGPDREENRIAVLLPGLGQHRGSFWILQRRLSMAGWRSVVGATHTRLDRIDAVLRDLDRLIRQIEPPNATIVLIGHGTGGLAARAYQQKQPGPVIRLVLTLGTPHQGTASSIVRLPCLRQLAPGSKWLAQLADESRAGGSRGQRVAIYSDFDAYVLPVDAAYDPAAFNVKVAGVGHFSMLTSRRIFKLLAENLPAPQQAVEKQAP